MVTYWPPTAVISHGFADAGALSVPTPLLMAVCTGVFLAAAAIPPRTATTVPELASNLRGTAAVAARVLVVAMLAAIVVPAAFGPTDAALNPAARLLFTVRWAGLLLVSALIGPWWRSASPLALAAGGSEDPPGDDAGDALWPAVAGLVVFGVAEQVLERPPCSC